MALSNCKHSCAYQSRTPRWAHKAGDQAVDVNFWGLARNTLEQNSVMGFPEWKSQDTLTALHWLLWSLRVIKASTLYDVGKPAVKARQSSRHPGPSLHARFLRAVGFFFAVTSRQGWGLRSSVSFCLQTTGCCRSRSGTPTHPRVSAKSNHPT